MQSSNQSVPALNRKMLPPHVAGAATLTTLAYEGANDATLRTLIGTESRGAGWHYDAGILAQLRHQRQEGLDRLDAALSKSHIFRISTGSGAERIRLLALVSPGDLMANVPLDFLTNHLKVRLDLLYIVPGQPLPAEIPDHDVAFFAVGAAGPDMLERLCDLYAAWPRPALNNPRYLPDMDRDALSHALAGIPGVCSPAAAMKSRRDLEQGTTLGYPCLIRPSGSHAGAELSLLQNPDDLSVYLGRSTEQQFIVTAFLDYRGTDGHYRKWRVLFIDRQPFLCHMAISNHWMVHYLNAGMTEDPAKRAEEEQAMLDFDTGFAGRHANAFDALHERLKLDYYAIDCAETPDGRLLVFEADAAAIVHMMDPPDLFPYKPPQMRKVFAAFEAMLRRRMIERPIAQGRQA